MKHIAFIVAALLATVAVAQDAAPPPADTRLDTQLTLDLTHVTVGDLCWVIEKRTGVVVTPADTETGDLYLSVVGDLTARHLLAALESVLGLEWRARRGTPATYALRRSPESLAAERRAPGIVAAAIRADLEQLIQLVNLSAEQREQLPPELKNRIGSSNRGSELYRMIAGLPPSALDRLAQGQPIIQQPLAAFSPATQRAALAYLRDQEERQRNADPTPFFESLPPDVRARREEDRARAQAAQAALTPEQRWARSIANPENLRLSFTPGPIDVNTDSLALAVSFVKRSGDGGRASGTGITLRPRLPAPASPRLNPDDRPAGLEQPLSEVAQNTLRQTGSPGDENALIRNLALALARPAVWDSHTASPSSGFGARRVAPQPEETVAAYLDRCAQAWKRQWGVEGETLTLRSIHWTVHRQQQLPASRQRAWEATIRRDGELTLDQVSEVMALPPAQREIAGGAVGLEILVLRSSGILLGNATRDAFLAIWPRLPQGAKRRILGDGLRVADLPQTVQPAAAAMVRQQFSAVAELAPLQVAQTRIQVGKIETGVRPDRPRDPNRPPTFQTRLLLTPPDVHWRQQFLPLGGGQERQIAAEAQRVSALQRAAGLVEE